MACIIRNMREEEYPLLRDFLCEAVYLPEGSDLHISWDLIASDPKCRAAVEGFGTRPDDRALVAEVDGEVVGACWVRTTDEYGHIDNETPSFSISLRGAYRGQGIGGMLLNRMLDELQGAEYTRASLSVQKENRALALYERSGFRIVGNGADESEWLMVCNLQRPRLSLSCRRLEIDDVSQFVELRIGQLLEEGAEETIDLRPALLDYYQRHLADDSFVSWLAFDKVGTIVATSGMSFVEKPPYFGCPTGRIGLLSSMYTSEAYRRCGIARDLLWRVLEEARAYACGTVQITASDLGTSLYESVGFTRNANFRQYVIS